MTAAAKRRDQAPPPPDPIGVIGAGTMGAGIAQLAAQSGARTLLHDPVPEALARGREEIEAGLRRLAERGRISQEQARIAAGRVEAVNELGALAPCRLVIEAAPERLELKRELFRSLAEIVAEDCVLASNTSSLSITEIAAGTPRPERVVGLHFFNPAPVMKLVELVAGEQSSADALALARAAGEAMGRRVIAAADVAGFLVNRCNRPFSLEALRVLGERLAAPEQIDRIVRRGGGFRMGPFELQDLVGIDTNFAVAEVFHRASYGEPRYQPSPLQARMVAAGRLGRKTGRGWYDYSAGTRSYRPPDPEPPEPGGGEGRTVLVTGTLPIARQLRDAAAQASFKVLEESFGAEPWLVVDCSGEMPGELPAARVRLLHDGSLAVREPAAAGFHLLAPLEGCRLVEMTRTPRTEARSLQRAEQFFTCLGLSVEHVGDGPGLVLGRIVATLINEAAFLLGEGLGEAEDLDAGMELGLNHPRGPVRWSAEAGLEQIVALLDALHRERGEPRYRTAPRLRALHALGASGLGEHA